MSGGIIPRIPSSTICLGDEDSWSTEESGSLSDGFVVSDDECDLDDEQWAAVQGYQQMLQRARRGTMSQHHSTIQSRKEEDEDEDNEDDEYNEYDVYDSDYYEEDDEEEEEEHVA